MSEPSAPATPASVQTRTEGGCLHAELSGRWLVTEPRPAWPDLAGEGEPRVVRVTFGEVGEWDSALLLFLSEVRNWCRARGVECDLTGVPPAVQALLGQWVEAKAKVAQGLRIPDPLSTVGLAAQEAFSGARTIYTFVGECVLSALSAARRPHKFRWLDCVAEMQKCGAQGLPIVSLISLLTGLIMAYQSAVLMRQFGADIYVADAVGLVMVREMGAMMTAVILAGRTGAAFAATLGNMRANEEIDALQTLGIRPVDFLVLPRVLALGLMTPLLALYANCLGILGGLLVAFGLLDLPPSAYWIETAKAIDLSDVSTGLIKAFVFGLLVALAGCQRGLRADRSAVGVGNAATSAVVTGLLLIIVADAIFAVVFNVLGL